MGLFGTEGPFLLPLPPPSFSFTFFYFPFFFFPLVNNSHLLIPHPDAEKRGAGRGGRKSKGTTIKKKRINGISKWGSILMF